jgi:hypothetical protein
MENEPERIGSMPAEFRRLLTAFHRAHDEAMTSLRNRDYDSVERSLTEERKIIAEHQALSNGLARLVPDADRMLLAETYEHLRGIAAALAKDVEAIVGIEHHLRDDYSFLKTHRSCEPEESWGTGEEPKATSPHGSGKLGGPST